MSLTITLLGVVAGEGQTIVVLRDDNGKVLRLGEDEVVDGWRIVTIHTRSIELERDGVRKNLRLPEAKNGNSLAVPAPSLSRPP